MFTVYNSGLVNMYTKWGYCYKLYDNSPAVKTVQLYVYVYARGPYRQLPTMLNLSTRKRM